MSTAAMIPIDYNKLVREFEKRGLTPSKVAESTGYATSYFSTAKARGYISRVMARTLELQYDIRPEEYEFAEPAPQAEPEVKQQTMDDVLRQLREAPIHIVEPALTPEDIEEAVYKGIVRALTENSRFATLVYRAIYGALKRMKKDGGTVQ